MIPRAARLHAFLHGLFEPGDMQLAREAFHETERLFRRHGLVSAEDRDRLIADIAGDIYETIIGVDEHFERHHVAEIVRVLFDHEEMFVLPDIDWSRRRSTSECWELRDTILVQRGLVEDYDERIEAIRKALANLFFVTAEASPPRDPGQAAGAAIRVATKRLDLMQGVPDLLDHLIGIVFADAVEKASLFPRVRKRLDRNLIAASGGNPADPATFKRMPKLPSKSDIADRRQLVGTYLGGTPLTRFFDGEIAFTIPETLRFEHHHIVAGTGHGKSQTLQYLIAHDLNAVERGEASVIVIDSQGDLINTIAGLKRFAPGEPLHERIVLIDPTDVEYPVSLNLFDVGIDRLASYPMLERERLTNSILELYDFVLGSLLDAGMTQKQSVIFRYVTRLMLHIPDATIHTLLELMEPGGDIKFAESIAKLTGTAKHFFETEFTSKEFEQTKRQVLRRLWGILENQTFERMFSHPRSKLDLYSEMNAGKVILINTAKDLLKENGTEIFGRFFIALIAQAAQERAVLPEHKRLPTFVYIDEAADYFDRNIGIILTQARKQKTGMILAHQYLGQLGPTLQDAFAANTSIKFAGGVSNKDARALAPMLASDPATIEAEPKGAFACSVRGLTKGAVSLAFPFGYVEVMEKMSRQESDLLKDRMRERYAVHYTEARPPEEREEVEDGVEKEDSDPPTDPEDDGQPMRWE
ncbi:helicase HerA domain-containing protein [Microbaculum marinum]|uniref:DUF87 domain-containing protein n=1 Tax=Microbaculum marinum TaxID=1764581 RepID=A0AAW9RKM8_9HYPH